jgi:hypothetical protein
MGEAEPAGTRASIELPAESGQYPCATSVRGRVETVSKFRDAAQTGIARYVAWLPEDTQPLALPVLATVGIALTVYLTGKQLLDMCRAVGRFIAPVWRAATGREKPKRPEEAAAEDAKVAREESEKTNEKLDRSQRGPRGTRRRPSLIRPTSPLGSTYRDFIGRPEILVRRSTPPIAPALWPRMIGSDMLQLVTKALAFWRSAT